MPMTSKQKKMIIRGVVSTVVVGLVIFSILFFGEIGPFSKYIAPDDFWKKVEEIVKEETVYNRQWYVKSKPRQEEDMWSVELYGSKDQEPATKDTVDKTIKESKMFAWSTMTKAQTDDCAAKFIIPDVHVEKDSKGDEVSIVQRLTKREAPPPLLKVKAKDFWKTVVKIQEEETSYQQWYVTGDRTGPGGPDAVWTMVLHGSTEDMVADKGNIEKTLKEGTKFIWSKMTVGKMYPTGGHCVKPDTELIHSKKAVDDRFVHWFCERFK